MVHLDSFKIIPTPNTDGMGNCLPASRGQVGSPDNFSIDDKQLCEKQHHYLVTFVYQDKSGYRDKVNRAAGRRTGVMVFAGATYKLHLDMILLPHLPGLSHLDSSAWTRNFESVYRDLGKNHATATLTATNQTAGPLAVSWANLLYDSNFIKSQRLTAKILYIRTI
jgi:hypothetical protein